MDQPITGGCLCGAIRYTVSTPLKNVVACHCTHCRKISGAGSSHNVIAPTSALTITAGTPSTYRDTADNGNILFRHFCGACGSSLSSRREKTPEMTVLKAGTLDDASHLTLGMNIWTASALPWMHIDPALDNHPGNRPMKS